MNNMHRVSKLKNGITLITVPVAGTRATTVLAMFPIGSRYETRGLSGAAHFLEHMLFKGTVNRPTALDISRALEAVGAEYNAYTNKDYTGYYIKIDRAKQALAFEVLADMLYNSKIERVEVEKEKGAIVEELRMYKDNPTMAVDMLFDTALFGDHPLGRDIGGTEKSVRGISQGALSKFYRTHYGPQNMVLVVAGSIDRRLSRLLNDFRAGQARFQAPRPQFYKKQFRRFVWSSRQLPLSARIFVEERPTDQAHLMLGFPGLPNNHPDRFAASLLITILGVGMSSRLFVEVRERRGLAYMVHAGSASYRDVGALYVQAGLDPARLKQALAVIQTELMRLTTEPVTARELADAKSNITGSLALGLENSKLQAEWFGKQAMFNRSIDTPDAVVRRLQRVRIPELTRLARRLFVPGELRLALIGAVKRVSVITMLASLAK